MLPGVPARYSAKAAASSASAARDGGGCPRPQRGAGSSSSLGELLARRKHKNQRGWLPAWSESRREGEGVGGSGSLPEATAVPVFWLITLSPGASSLGFYAVLCFTQRLGFVLFLSLLLWEIICFRNPFPLWIGFLKIFESPVKKKSVSLLS